MTYCVAWRTETSTFIITDSAATSLSPYSYEQVGSHTSFGELQGGVTKRNEYVSESAFKIYTHENTAICLSGDSNFGHNFIAILIDHLRYGATHQEALNRAIANFQNIRSEPQIKIAIAFHLSYPELITFDNRAEASIQTDVEYASFGSPPDDLKKYTKSFWQGFKETWIQEKYLAAEADERFLMRMLGLLQVYGIHNPTISERIGGAYTGIYVSANGLNTQPNVCYLVSGETVAFEIQRIVSICVKTDHFCIISNGEHNLLITNTTCCPNQDGPRLSASFGDAVNEFDNGQFGYVVLLNTARHSASIVQMNDNIHHQLLSIDIHGNNPETLGFIISEALVKIHNDYHQPIETPKYALITFTPYIPISADKLSLVEAQLERLRIEKIHGEAMDTLKFITYENSQPKEWFFGTPTTILPFINHYKNSELIRVVDLSSDCVVLEYSSEKIIFPEPELDLNQVFGKITKKIRNENLYLFEILSETILPDSFELSIFSSNFEDAKEKATQQASLNFDNFRLIFVGVRFYHPAYAF